MIYNTADEARAVELLKKYQVRWIVVGGIEKRIYQEGGLSKFKRIAKVVRSNKGATLYRYEPSK